jgi:radical SAM superfamily enzyme
VKLLSQPEYTDILIDFLELTPKDRVILRLVSDSDVDSLIEPKWVNEKQMVMVGIEKEMENRKAYQGRLVAR